MSGLSEEYMDLIKNTLAKYLDKNRYEFFIFGSRATGTARKYSDIDIGIKGEKPVQTETLIEIKHEIEETDIPYRIDLVDFFKLDDKFKEVANQAIIKIT